MKLLLVDDHAILREGLRHLLESLAPNIMVLEAADCASGLAVLDHHPDVALTLLDLNMPGSAGLSALRQFREAWPQVPVVVLAADADPRTVRAAIDTGAMGFIPKALGSRELLDALATVMRGAVYLPAGLLDEPPHDPAQAGRQVLASLGLSPRRQDVLCLLVRGLSAREIASRLQVSETTVKTHMSNIYRVLGVAGRSEAVYRMASMGLGLDFFDQLTPADQGED